MKKILQRVTQALNISLRQLFTIVSPSDVVGKDELTVIPAKILSEEYCMKILIPNNLFKNILG